MKILIDADGCPVVDICLETAKSRSVRCIILCDTSHIFEREGAETVTVSKGADSVDFKIVNMLDRGDIVVTQDYDVPGPRGKSIEPKRTDIHRRQHRLAAQFALRDKEVPNGGRQNKGSAKAPSVSG